jgi:hypothetical protein
MFEKHCTMQHVLHLNRNVIDKQWIHLSTFKHNFSYLIAKLPYGRVSSVENMIYIYPVSICVMLSVSSGYWSWHFKNSILMVNFYASSSCTGFYYRNSIHSILCSVFSSFFLMNKWTLIHSRDYKVLFIDRLSLNLYYLWGRHDYLYNFVDKVSEI